MSYKLYYGDFEFPYNPESLKIQKKRKLKIYNTPSKKVLTQDLGYQPTVVTGVGTFIGSDADEQYAQLYNSLVANPQEMLKLPYVNAMEYHFNSLEIIFRGKNNSISYAFEFTSVSQ